MSTVTTDRTLDHEPEAVWAALADFGGIYRFHPLVHSSPISPGAPATGVGAERTCHFNDGNHVLERVVEFEEGSHLVVDIVEGSMPLQSARARMEIRPASNGKTTITMRMEYIPKFGLLGKAMDALMLKRKFASILDGVLAALGEHLKTGEVIGPEFKAA